MSTKNPWWLYCLGFVLLFSLHIFLLLSLRFTAWPEMLAYPYLINKGFHFYGDIIHPFVPLLVVTLSLIFRLWGNTLEVLKAFTIIVILISDGLLVWVVNKLFKKIRYTLFGLALYIILQICFEGNGMWFDLAVAPLLICSFLTAVNWFGENKKIWAIATGILFAIALLVKLSTIWIVGAVLFLALGTRRKYIWSFLTSVLFFSFTILLFLVRIFDLGNWQNIFYWGFIYPLFIVIRMPGYFSPPSLGQAVFSMGILAPLCLILIITSIKLRNTTVYLALIFFFGAVFFGLHRFGYFHFQPALPFFVIGLLAYLKFFRPLIKQKKRSYQTVLIGLSLSLILLLFVRTVITDWDKDTRFAEGSVLEETSEISSIIPFGEEVFFYNVPSQYFALSDLLPPAPWADTFPWYLELPGIQERVVASLEEKKITYILFDPFIPGSTYTLGSYKPQIIDAYIGQHYKENRIIGKNKRLLKRIDI